MGHAQIWADPLASLLVALISTGSALLGVYFANRNARSIKRDELNFAIETERRQRRREAGEAIYRLLKKLGRISCGMASAALDILERRVDPITGSLATGPLIKQIMEFEKLDTDGAALAVAVHFPHLKPNYERLDTALARLATLTEFTRDNLDALFAAHEGRGDPVTFDRTLASVPSELADSIGELCRRIVAELD